MTQLFCNNVRTTLASAAGIGDSTLTVANPAGMPTPTGGDYFLMTLSNIGVESQWEIIKCNARSGSILNVVRAQEGSTARAWPVGAKFEHRWTKGSAENMLQQGQGGGGGVDANGVLHIPVGTPPSTSPAGEVQLYAEVSPVGVSAVPNMTSYTAPSGVMSASSTYASGIPGIFSIAGTPGVGSNGWLSSATAPPHWVQYQFPSAETITSYELIPWSVDNFPSRTPTSWTLNGSNNGTDWTTIDTRVVLSSSWVLNMPTSFLIASPGAYVFYRLAITANGGDSYTGIKYMRLLRASTTLVLKVRDSDGHISVLSFA